MLLSINTDFIIPPDKLHLLADWFDEYDLDYAKRYGVKRGNGVQKDLRRMATYLEICIKNVENAR